MDLAEVPGVVKKPFDKKNPEFIKTLEKAQKFQKQY